MKRILTVFTLEFHILAPLPNLTQIQSLSNNLDHICHLVVNLVYQRIVTGSTGSFVAGHAGSLVPENAVHLAAAGGFGPGNVGNSSVVVTMCLVIECMGCSAGGTEHFVVVVLANHHPSPLLYFFTNGAI